MNTEEKFYVYFLCDPTRPLNGKSFKGYTLEYEPYYCGKGTGRRYKDKKNQAVTCKTKSILDKGLEPHYVIIGLYDEETAFSLEDYFVKLFKRRDLFDDGLLLNLQDGGTGGICPSIESRQKMSESHKGHTPWNKGKRGLQSSPNKGKTMPESVKEKLRSANLGRPAWNKGKKYRLGSKHPDSKRVIYNGVEFETIKDAVKQTGISSYRLKKEGYVV